MHACRSTLEDPTAYPFALSPAALEKLRYVHDVIGETRSQAAGGEARPAGQAASDNTGKLQGKTADAAQNTAQANQVAEQSRQESDAVPEQQ